MHETGRRGRLSRKASIEDEIAQLRDLDLRGLRVRLRNAFGKPAPEHLTWEELDLESVIVVS